MQRPLFDVLLMGTVGRVETVGTAMEALVTSKAAWLAQMVAVVMQSAHEILQGALVRVEVGGNMVAHKVVLFVLSSFSWRAQCTWGPLWVLLLRGSLVVAQNLMTKHRRFWYVWDVGGVSTMLFRVFWRSCLVMEIDERMVSFFCGVRKASF